MFNLRGIFLVIIFHNLQLCVCKSTLHYPKIIGGKDAAIEDFPFAVSIQNYAMTYKHFCTSGLVKPNFILTLYL